MGTIGKWTVVGWLLAAGSSALAAPSPAALVLPERTVSGVEIALRAGTGDRYRINVPQFHAVFDRYTVVAPSEKAGVCLVRAVSKSFPRDRYGGAARTAFALTVRQLTEEYGPPNRTVDSLKDGAHWTGATEWVMAVYRNERVYQAEWRPAGGAPLKDNVAGLLLRVLAAETDRAYISLEYRFADSAGCASFNGIVVGRPSAAG